MSRVVVIGAGICGLAAALLLARDGHEVLVLEKDPTPEPESLDDCWERWVRRGVAQFRQPHNFMPALRLLLEAELPDVQEALVAAGAARFDLLNPLPKWLSGSPAQPIDDQLWTWTCRRPTGEWVFLKAAEAQQGITVRRGESVAALTTGPEARAGTPNVTGVRTAAGEEIAADLVVDASGRGTRSGQWLRSIGCEPPQEQRADFNFTYYTRYFRGTEPERLAPPLTEFGTMSILTLPGDGGTWSVTLFTSANDRELTGLREADAWTRVVAAHPLHAHWLGEEPISDVLPIGGVADCYRSLSRDGDPVVTGFVTVADAWACTNPSAGRGMTIGMLHALLLRDVLREHGDEPWRLTKEFARRTESELKPWYDAQIASDGSRFEIIESNRTGRPPRPAHSPLDADLQLLRVAMLADGALFRLGLEYVATLTPIQEIMARDGVRDTMRAAAAGLRQRPPPPLPGPTREQLVALAQA